MDHTTVGEPPPHAGAAQASPGARPMRVCMHVLGAGRTTVHVMREARALVAAGYDVTVVDLERDASHPAEEDVDGIHFRHLLLPGRFVKSRIRLWYLTQVVVGILRGALLVARTPADVYHSHDEHALLACFLAATLRRKPLIFDAHELPLTQRNIMRWPPLNAIGQWALRRIVPRCAAVIAVSTPIIDEMQRRFGGKRAALLRNIPPYTPPVIGSDRLRERLGVGPETRIALYQGGLQANRSLEILVRTGTYLAPHEMIVLMGPGPLYGMLEALIQQEGVGDRVKLLPAVPYDELLAWTASADVGLIVFDGAYSLSIKYCLPNKLFEYLMAGLPILAAPLPAVAEIVTTYDVGAITPSIAPEVVARSLSALLADDAARARMRQNGLAAARQELRWEIEQQRLLDVYAQTIGAPAPAAAPVATAVG